METLNTVTAQMAAGFVRDGWDTGEGLTPVQDLVREALVQAQDGLVTLPQDVADVVVAWNQATTVHGA